MPTPGLRLAGLLLAAPLFWLVVDYLGALAILLLNAFWTKDAFTGQVEPFAWTLDAVPGDLRATTSTGRSRSGRSVIAITVTITDALLALPIAYYMARMAIPRRTRGLLVVAILMPLWASYLVKVYAWRTILQGGRLPGMAPRLVRHPAARASTSSSTAWLVFSYLWLPYMILPIYAGLERIPRSLLEASSDLGGTSRHDVPASRPAARLPGARRRLDLHVLAHAWRLHHARTSSATRSSSAT